MSEKITSKTILPMLEYAIEQLDKRDVSRAYILSPQQVKRYVDAFKIEPLLTLDDFIAMEIMNGKDNK